MSDLDYLERVARLATEKPDFSYGMAKRKFRAVFDPVCAINLIAELRAAERALLDARISLELVRGIHTQKSGENDRGSYGTCRGCSADWPCATSRAISPPDV
jgi:hypothetical protein